MDTTFASAAYGQACANCARAKCKCLIPDSGGSCARCRRLNKECRPASRVRKCNPRRAGSKTAELEQKLDGLMSLLRATGDQKIVTVPNPSHHDPVLSSVSQSSSPWGSQGSPANLSTPTSATPSAGPHHGPMTVHLGEINSKAAEEEEMLRAFRTGQLSQLPFIHLPASRTVQELKRDSPFLWLCISTVQCKNNGYRSSLSNSIRETVAKALLVDCEKSLDLLQGLLIYLGWVTFDSGPQHKSSLCVYMQMALGLVFVLGLDRPNLQDPNMNPLCYLNVAKDPHSRCPLLGVRTMDERRAVLSCFLLSSSISHFLGKMDPLRWTPYLKECLDVLADSKETPNDEVLVQHIRIQLIIDKVLRGMENHCEMTSDDKAAHRAPPSFYIKALQSQLEGITNEMLPDLSQNKIILLHLYHAEVTVYGTALLKPTIESNDVDFTRLDHLFTCLKAVEKWVQLLLTFPSSAYIFFPVTIMSHMAQCLVTLFRLSTFEYPGWDKAVVRNTVDLLSIAQQVSDKLAHVAEEAGIQKGGPDGDSFSRAARFILKLRDGWASRLADLQMTAVDQVPVIPTVDQFLLDNWSTWSDNIWLVDSLASGV